MNTNAVYPYCKPYYSDNEPNNFGYHVSLMYLGYNTQKPLKINIKIIENYINYFL